MKVGLLLMKNILTILAESVLVPSELMLVASAIDAPIQKKILKFGTTTLISSNEDFNGVRKFIKSLKNFDLKINGQRCYWDS